MQPKLIKQLSWPIFGAFIGVISIPQRGEAGADRRMQAQYCRTQHDNFGPDVGLGATLANRTGSTIVIRCAVPTDSKRSHADATILNVHGFEGDVNTRSKACVGDFASSSVACGSYKSWGSDYAGARGLDVSPWQGNRFGYPYVLTELGDGSALYGYYTHNP